MAWKVIYNVDALHPGEPQVHHEVLFTTPYADVIEYVENLSFFEYPKGEGFIRARDISVQSV